MSETASAVTLIVCIKKRAPHQPACGNRDSETLASDLEMDLKARGSSITVKQIECLGECAKGPNIRIAPGGPIFHHVKREHLEKIVDDAVKFQDGLQG
ncbi:MAG: (2Fe-2S) ferredoxin domain-containing protein [Magnetococcales bacterium]|nr:(2Fe-2S) ferredoxin domain-containing protein [Magnetococcales bacterium]